jgi:hypothetical protein
MRKNSLKSRTFGINRLVILAIVIGLIAGLPLLACAFARSPVSTNVTIVNDSTSAEIHHVYLSPVDNNNWSGDQLDGRVITSGSSFTLNNVSCDSGSIKVIAEDKNGCFFYQIVACGENSTWTITNSSTPDCGN